LLNVSASTGNQPKIAAPTVYMCLPIVDFEKSIHWSIRVVSKTPTPPKRESGLDLAKNLAIAALSKRT